MEQRARLRLVPPVGPAPVAEPEPGDLGLLAFLLAVNLIPIGGALAGGRWGEGSLGFATLMSVLCVRGLALELRARRAP